MTLRLGTRGSKLALAQADEVAASLRARGVETELVPITTSGDRGADPASDPAGVKGLFVTEIVRALLAGDVDLAVLSAKDLPATDDEGVVIAAVPERASALDVLVTRDGELQPGARVGTSSVRRQAQVFRWRPDVLVSDAASPEHDSYALVGKVPSLEPTRGGRIPAAALTAFST